MNNETRLVEPIRLALNYFEAAKSELAKDEQESRRLAAQLAETEDGYHTEALQEFRGSVDVVLKSRDKVERSRVFLEMAETGVAGVAGEALSDRVLSETSTPCAVCGGSMKDGERCKRTPAGPTHHTCSVLAAQAVAGETKCIVLRCPNKQWQGTFVGSICTPCHIFITTGKGKTSQAFRNAVSTAIGVIEGIAGLSTDPDSEVG